MAKDTVWLHDESRKSSANGETMNSCTGHAPGTLSLRRRAFLRNMGGSVLASVLGLPRLGGSATSAKKVARGRLKQLLDDPVLMAPGRRRSYRGKHLEAIAFPVGGIGTGCIQMDGKGQRWIWQIFNNFRPMFVPHSFFAVRAAITDKPAVLRALQTEDIGILKAVERLSFHGEYPVGRYDFEDKQLPVAVQLETFNPMVPLNEKDSAIPCAIFNLTARNITRHPVDVTFLATQQNAVGLSGNTLDDAARFVVLDPHEKSPNAGGNGEKIEGRRFRSYGRNLNRVLRRSGATILHMTSAREASDAGYGDMALSALTEGASGTASWESLEELVEKVRKDGGLEGIARAGPSHEGQTLDGALAIPFTLQGGQEHTVTVVLTWHFPNAIHGMGRWKHKGNMYANWWSDALEVAEYLHEHYPRLAEQTRLYHDTFYKTNLPHWLLDRITSQMAVLRTKTCFWAQDGYFGGWEGCKPEAGCCFGNCTHVWHYTQGHARLFPALARRMREQSLALSNKEGGIPNRHPAGNTAFDGQCGEILAAYREHLNSCDGAWLENHWPQIRQCMNYVIQKWDPNEEGMPGGRRPNTLDASLSGPDPWLGTLYLASLAAAERMAKIQQDAASAGRYRAIFAEGSRKQDEKFWNGEYYIQLPSDQPGENYFTGCHIDQLLGQWWSHQLNLGWIYRPQRVRRAMQSLFKYNFHKDFSDVFLTLDTVPRRFVEQSDQGLLMTTWPKGGRPDPDTATVKQKLKTVRFANEVMSAFEYSAASEMVYCGLIREGLRVVKAVSDRYDGRLRVPVTNRAWSYTGNPFGDDECGKFYSRAMSVWSMLLACQGFIYNGPEKEIGFKPNWKGEDHVSFFTASEGWGIFSQKRQGNRQIGRIEIASGKLRMRRFVCRIPSGHKARALRVNAGGQVVSCKFVQKDSEITIVTESELTIETGRSCEVVLEYS